MQENTPVEQLDFGGEIVWRPTKSHIENSNLKRFMDRHAIGSFDEMMKRSTDDIAWFWDAALKELDVRFDTPYSKVVDLSKGVQFPRWCVGGKMNVVTSLLDKCAGTANDDRVAVISEGEEGEVRKLT